MTQAVVISTLRAMRHHLSGKLLLLWDGLPAHRARGVRDFLTGQAAWLRVERFPAYAPELNPVEYLWSASKRKDLANRCPTDIAEMDDALRRSAQRIRRHPDVLQGFLKASGLFLKISR